jgi:hypothetical protein
MTPPAYSFRKTLFGRKRSYTLAPEGLVRSTAAQRDVIAYQAFSSLHLTQVYLEYTGMVDCCRLKAPGSTVQLKSAHYAGLFNVEDRRSSYEPFVWELVQRVIRANPEVCVSIGESWLSQAGWLFTLALIAALGLGGLALLVTGRWTGLWLIASAMTALPVILAMLNRKPSGLVAVSRLATATNYRELVGS